MVDYIGNFNDVEKAYTEHYCEKNSVVIKQNSFFPLSSLSEINEYIDFLDNPRQIYFFNKKRNKLIERIVTPAIFSSNILPENEADLLTSDECLVYIQQGCSEQCICTSAYKCKISVSFEKVKAQILQLPQHKYISLYGINIGDYNYEGKDIIDLCKYILEEFPDSNIVLCNISPFSSKLEKLVKYIIEESRIIPILYMCINSGSQKILNIEGHYNITNNLIALLKDTNIKIVPYLIVGSPEEELEDFELTIDWVKKHKDLLFGAIVLPYTNNGIGNCNLTISTNELKRRLKKLDDIVLELCHYENNTSLSNTKLLNLIEVAICGEDHEFYK